MKFLKNYAFIFFMLIGIVAGCVTGAFWPGAKALEPLGTLFINMMFCIVVPMVFCSIASAVANMDNAKRAGKLMGTTLVTFCWASSARSTCPCCPLKHSRRSHSGTDCRCRNSGDM